MLGKIAMVGLLCFMASIYLNMTFHEGIYLIVSGTSNKTTVNFDNNTFRTVTKYAFNGSTNFNMYIYHVILSLCIMSVAFLLLEMICALIRM